MFGCVQKLKLRREEKYKKNSIKKKNHFFLKEKSVLKKSLS